MNEVYWLWHNSKLTLLNIFKAEQLEGLRFNVQLRWHLDWLGGRGILLIQSQCFEEYRPHENVITYDIPFWETSIWPGKTKKVYAKNSGLERWRAVHAFRSDQKLILLHGWQLIIRKHFSVQYLKESNFCKYLSANYSLSSNLHPKFGGHFIQSWEQRGLMITE